MNILLSEEIKEYVKKELCLTSIDKIDSIVLLTEGKSDAQVFRIHVISNSKRNTGYYIVKIIDTRKPWYSHSQHEGTKGKQAYDMAGNFQEHISRVISSQEIDGNLVVIYQQANGTVLQSVSLEKLNLSKAVSVMRKISYDILKKWNIDYTIVNDESNFFNDLLSYRLEQNGAFEIRTEKYLERANARAFIYRNHIYPNPLFYIQNISLWKSCLPSNTFLRGKIHGDFHRRNIVASEITSATKYSLIDFDSFRESFLFFDHAYLETSIMFETTINLDMEHWLQTARTLVQTDILSDIENYIDQPVYSYRNAICNGIQKWIEEEQLQFTDTCIVQMYMARIAAGVNYFSKQSITDDISLMRLLIYTAICFEKFFDVIGFEDDYSIDNVRLNTETGNEDLSILLEKSWLQYLPVHYVPILITDDCYENTDYMNFQGLGKVKWVLAIEIGKKCAPNDFSTCVSQICSHYQKIERYNLNVDDAKEINVVTDTCLWLQAKKEDDTYLKLWRNNKSLLRQVMKQIYTSQGLKSLLFLIDVKYAEKFVWNYIVDLMDREEQIQGARIVELRNKTIDEETLSACKELDIDYTAINDATLLDVARIAEKQIPIDAKGLDGAIILPSIQEEGIVRLSSEDVRFYETSIELVYPGMEALVESWDYGEAFYKGREIQWVDLANDCDIPLLQNYDSYCKKLMHIVEEDSPRVKIIKILHEPGAGGTTLAKRLMWDLKERIPCLRLKNYSAETNNIILSIYRKTKKRVLLLVEAGSTIISHDQLSELCYSINEDNGRLLILMIERRINENDIEEEQEDELIKENKSNVLFFLTAMIEDDRVANRFFQKFMAKTADEERHELLKKITSSSSGLPWIQQRTPFFYGFYTFQEEYDLGHFGLHGRVDSEYEKELLSDLALVTKYSQNICVPYPELYRRNQLEYLSVSMARFYEQHSRTVKMFIVEKDEGWRICHPVIAEMLLKKIYDHDNWKDCIFDASINYIVRLYYLYGNESEYVDKILRELFIDRSEFNTEKSSFAEIVKDIDKVVQRKELFQKLIDCYPKNPHYYSHMARLLSDKSSGNATDFDKAIKLLNKAIEIAEEEHLPETSHFITLGSVYGRKIADYINCEKDNRRRGTLAAKNVGELIEAIQDMYKSAEKAFHSARKFMKRMDSYYFYPYMSLEITILNRLFDFDEHEYPLKKLYERDEAYRKWYDVHYAKAVSLLEDMQKNVESVDPNYKKYLRLAKTRIDGISIHDEEWMKKQLKRWANEDGREAALHRRMYVSSIYSKWGYDWTNVDKELLEMVRQSIYKNILSIPFVDADSADIYRWYSVVSNLDDFDSTVVIEIFDENLKEDYRKEYILYQMYFLRLLKGVSSVKEVALHINKCKALVPRGINDISNRAAYFKTGDRTCNPITSLNNVKLNDKIQSSLLVDFTGRIVSVSDTSHGKIEMDEYNISISFNPIFTDDSGKRIEFFTKDEQKPVVFNLMFSYSGLRAWNVRLIENE